MTTDTPGQSINDGGPAFPRTVQKWDDSLHPVSHGMSLRDWFAGQVAAAIINGLASTGVSTSAEDVPLIAASAYKFADAMLAARAEGRQP